MDDMDKRKFGYYVFGGMLIGALLGLSLAGILGLASGAFAGMFIGWFAGAYFLQIGTEKRDEVAQMVPLGRRGACLLIEQRILSDGLVSDGRTPQPT